MRTYNEWESNARKSFDPQEPSVPGVDALGLAAVIKVSLIIKLNRSSRVDLPVL